MAVDSQKRLERSIVLLDRQSPHGAVAGCGSFFCKVQGLIEPAKELEAFLSRRLGFLLGWHFAIADLVSYRFPEPQ